MLTASIKILKRFALKTWHFVSDIKPNITSIKTFIKYCQKIYNKKLYLKISSEYFFLLNKQFNTYI